MVLVVASDCCVAFFPSVLLVLLVLVGEVAAELAVVLLMSFAIKEAILDEALSSIAEILALDVDTATAELLAKAGVGTVMVNEPDGKGTTMTDAEADAEADADADADEEFDDVNNAFVGFTDDVPEVDGAVFEVVEEDVFSWSTGLLVPAGFGMPCGR